MHIRWCDGPPQSSYHTGQADNGGLIQATVISPSSEGARTREIGDMFKAPYPSEFRGHLTKLRGPWSLRTAFLRAQDSVQLLLLPREESADGLLPSRAPLRHEFAIRFVVLIAEEGF